MSITITTDVFCDDCSRPARYPLTSSQPQVQKAKEHLRLVGWTFTRALGPVHVCCPACNGSNLEYWDRSPKELPA